MKLKREMVPITAIGVGLVASAAILTPLALHWKKQNYYTLNDAYVSQLKSVSDLLTKSREALATKTAWLVQNGLIETLLSPNDAALTQVSVYNARLADSSDCLKAIIQNKISVPIDDNQGFDDQDVSDAYGLVVNLNKELGLPTIDWISEINNRPSDIYDSTYSSYQSRGYTNAEADDVASIMRTAYSDAATTGGSNYADTFQINNYNVTNLEEHHINTYLKSTDQINYQNAVLAGVLSKFQVMLGGDLSLKSGPDLAFLISKIDGYSDNAPYNTNPENNEIDKTDVAQMFNLRVDTTYSVDYSDSDIPSIDYTKISSTTTFDSTLSIYKDIDFSQGYKNDVSQVVWSECEPIPGYQLHIKIIELDNTTDSSVCKATLQFGVSLNDEPDIWWGSDDTIIIKQDVNIPVENLANKQYIADNTYYPEIQYDFGSLDVDGGNNRITTGIGNRPFLEDVIAKFSNCFKTNSSGVREYDFTDHNIALALSDIVDIPINSISLADGNTLTPYGGLLHTNQQLQFVVTDINTDSGTSALIGYFGVVDNKKAANDTNDIEIVKKLPCLLNGNPSETVMIGFNLNGNDRKWVEYGTRITDGVKSILTVADTLKSHWSNYDGVTSALDNAITDRKIAIAFRALSAAAAIVAAVIDAISFNGTALAADVVVLAIDTAADICEGIVTEEESNIESDAISVEKTSGAIAGFNPNTNKFDSDSLDDLEVTWTDWNTNATITDKFINFVNKVDELMDDPEGVINDKVSAAKQVNLVLSTATFQDVAIFTYIENWLVSSFNNFRINHGESQLSADEKNQISNEFNNIDPDNTATDNHAVNVAALINKSTLLASNAILNAFNLIASEGDQSDDRMEKFESLITTLKQELSNVLACTNDSSQEILEISEDIFKTAEILTTIRTVIDGIDALKTVLTTVQAVANNAMEASPLLDVLSLVLSIVSIICDTCAQTAMDWAPSDSK